MDCQLHLSGVCLCGPVSLLRLQLGRAWDHRVKESLRVPSPSVKESFSDNLSATRAFDAAENPRLFTRPRPRAEGRVSHETPLAMRAAEDGSLRLHSLCRKRGSSPAQIAALLAKDAKAATALDSKHRLPLHWAAEKHATVETVGALLEVYRDGARIADVSGLLPLHLAAGSRASSSVLKLLVEANPEGAASCDSICYRVPLHFAAIRKGNIEAVASLLECYPAAAGLVDGDGQTPVELATGHGAGDEVVRMLGEALAACATQCTTPRPRRHYNQSLGAFNVWEVELPSQSLTEALCIFERCSLRHSFESLRSSAHRHQRIQSSDPGCPERFFAVRAGGYASEDRGRAATDEQPDPTLHQDSSAWASDVTWISVDDEATHAQFVSIFESCNLQKTFGPICGIDEKLRMYSASYVVRSQCAAPNYHFDYVDGVHARAFTLMAPLKQFKRSEDADQLGHFQLIYKSDSPPDAAVESEAQCRRGRRYDYNHGKAVVFSDGFYHSTQPGKAAEDGGAPHAYLCFTFGTDRQESWPLIAQTIDGDQSRLLCRPDGQFVLTQLGREMHLEHMRGSGDLED